MPNKKKEMVKNVCWYYKCCLFPTYSTLSWASDFMLFYDYTQMNGNCFLHSYLKFKGRLHWNPAYFFLDMVPDKRNVYDLDNDLFSLSIFLEALLFTGIQPHARKTCIILCGFLLGSLFPHHSISQIDLFLDFKFGPQFSPKIFSFLFPFILSAFLENDFVLLSSLLPLTVSAPIVILSWWIYTHLQEKNLKWFFPSISIHIHCHAYCYLRTVRSAVIMHKSVCGHFSIL